MSADSYHTPVRIVEDFLDAKQCQYLIDTYDKMCKRSTVVDALGNDVIDPARTSSTYFIPDSDPVIIEMKKKSAALTGAPFENIEGLQIVRYTKGEQYKFHYDYFDAIQHNQRVHTVLIYLNDLEMEDGGATIFKKYRLKIYPRCGRAIWFRNKLEDGKVNDMSLHAGEEILGDKVKYAINVWIREKAVGPYEPALPANGGVTIPSAEGEGNAKGVDWWRMLLVAALTMFVVAAILVYTPMGAKVTRGLGKIAERWVPKMGGGSVSI